MKRLISLCLVIFISFTMISGVSAARNTSYETKLAQNLKSLGLFQGVSDTEFDLDRAPTRIEALVMLIRVLGKEKEAKNGNYRHPFTDVPKWADSYVGYAYQNNLSNGTSPTTFGTENANAAMYLTFMLRALGYSDTGGKDFVWDNPFSLAEKTGILPQAVNRARFLRADVVLVSYASLSAKLKNSSLSLADKLIQSKVFTQKEYNTYYDATSLMNYLPSDDSLNAEEIYEKCSSAVFYIEVYDEAGYAMESGSGFFLTSNGIAITNYHVIDGMSSAIITHSATQQNYKVEGVYDYDIQNDWAILKIEGSGFDSLSIGDPSTIVGGSAVYAIGSPMGLQNTISEGIISNTNRIIDNVTYIQTSAPISHGSSGGAFLNKYGEVIGITSAGFTEGENLGLAIPISVIEGYQTNQLISLHDLYLSYYADHRPSDNLYNMTTEQILSAFIQEYYTKSYDEGILINRTEPLDEGTIDFSIYLDNDGTLSSVVYILRDDSSVYFSIDINDPEQNKFVFFTYEDIYGSEFIGTQSLNSAYVTKNTSLSLKKEEGNEYFYKLQDIANLSLFFSLNFTDTLLKTLSSELGLPFTMSIADFGFTNF